jgi:hypothetical protein
MKALFILLGHQLITIAKLLRPGGARAIVATHSNCPGLPYRDFALYTSRAS